MPAIIILETKTGGLFDTFDRFMRPIYELLIKNAFRMISVNPELALDRSRRVQTEEIVFLSDDNIQPAVIRKLAATIKSTSGRPRFIKRIFFTIQIISA